MAKVTPMEESLYQSGPSPPAVPGRRVQSRAIHSTVHLYTVHSTVHLYTVLDTCAQYTVLYTVHIVVVVVVVTPVPIIHV